MGEEEPGKGRWQWFCLRVDSAEMRSGYTCDSIFRENQKNTHFLKIGFCSLDLWCLIWLPLASGGYLNLNELEKLLVHTRPISNAQWPPGATGCQFLSLGFSGHAHHHINFCWLVLRSLGNIFKNGYRRGQRGYKSNTLILEVICWKTRKSCHWSGTYARLPASSMHTLCSLIGRNTSFPRALLPEGKGRAVLTFPQAFVREEGMGAEVKGT